MAYAPGGKQAEAGGAAPGGGGLPLPGFQDPSIVGGLASYTMASFWLFLTWAGWVIALGGLAGVQGFNNAQGNDNGYLRNRYMHANYPDLGAGDLLRFDWFTVFLLFITLCLISAALVTRELVKARVAVVAFLAVSLTLVILSADRMHNLTDMYIGDGHFAGARCAFAGLVIAAIGGFGLLYHLGISRGGA